MAGEFDNAGRRKPSILRMTNTAALHQPLHGGDLFAASQRYPVALDEWIDLSTGINPEAYPHDDIQSSAFCQLPYLRAEFYAAAKTYYAAANILAVSGSQAVIQALPHILQRKTLLIPQVGYQEYAKHWRKAGALTQPYPSFEIAASRHAIEQSLAAQPDQHVLIINPNNPTGQIFRRDDLLHFANMLADNAYLIVDEAFADLQPSGSLLGKPLPDNIIVLRSFGKFFGLAGIRLGFVVANDAILAALNARLGLWQVNGPAQDLAIKALNDTVWQQKARQNIQQNAAYCQQLFQPLVQYSGALKAIHQGLFSSYVLKRQTAYDIFEYFAHAGVLFRVVEVDPQHAILRMGILLTSAEEAIQTIQRTIDAYCDDNRLNTLAQL